MRNKRNWGVWFRSFPRSVSATPVDNMFSSSTGPDIFYFAPYGKISAHTCTFFVVSVFACAILFVWRVIILIGSFFIPVEFHAGIPKFRSAPSLRLALLRASVALSIVTVFRIPSSSTLTVSGLANMTLNGPTLLDNNFCESHVCHECWFIHLYRGSVNKDALPGCNCAVCQKVLSKWRL